MGYSKEDVAARIDHTILKADARREEIIRLCREAHAYGFKAVCVQPCHVETCIDELRGADVVAAAVVGFPLGANCPEVKAYEAGKVLALGAREVDMVMNIGALKDRRIEDLYQDIRAVVTAAEAYPGAIIKVIIETALLTDEEKTLAAQTAVRAGAQYVKTSTGFGGSGATVEDISLMVQAVAGRAKIKASGGIKTRSQAEALLAAGADRLGTSSGIAIMREYD